MICALGHVTHGYDSGDEFIAVGQAAAVEDCHTVGEQGLVDVNAIVSYHTDAQVGVASIPGTALSQLADLKFVGTICSLTEKAPLLSHTVHCQELV